MSYAGTYGEDETCNHGRYWRSCAFCSGIGPRATREQIDEHHRRRLQEIEGLHAAEAKRCEMYAELNPNERKVADALWASLLLSYPGLAGISLDEAVRKQGLNSPRDSWAVGRARSTCRLAQIATAALTP